MTRGLGQTRPGAATSVSLLAVGLFLLLWLPAASAAQTAPDAALPALSEPVNDFAGVIDPQSRQALDSLIRRVQAATGDTIIVATIDTASDHGDIRSYANELFENRGRGIGEKGKDNGLLVLLAVRDRRVWIEVGYGLEGFITDGLAGEISREEMTPYFKRGEYGAGLLAGASRLAARIAQERGVTLEGLPAPARSSPRQEESDDDPRVVLFIVVGIIILIALSSRSRRRRRRVFWGGGPWSGWGGGGYGGSFGGGGGFSGGGFGGFGGGGSGGGGGGSSW